MPELAKARDLVLTTGAVASSISEGRRWAQLAADALATLAPGRPGANGAGGRVPQANPEVRQTLATLAHQLLDDLAVRTT
jgi:hypothetical protein